VVIKDIQGDFELKNVFFRYPMKLDIPVLQGINLKFEKNKKTALVGESGCGKSTIVQMLQRFYDPDEGCITVDGHELKSVYLKAFRKHIGYVG